ncbi:Uncharacterised protein [Enterobacter hormaechei]|nr:Uncharacterised protein [Enterobacter hormaechei]
MPGYLKARLTAIPALQTLDMKVLPENKCINSVNLEVPHGHIKEEAIARLNRRAHAVTVYSHDLHIVLRSVTKEGARMFTCELNSMQNFYNSES